MATVSPIAGLPRPELADPPNGPQAFVNLTNALDLMVIPRFASATARNAAIPNPTHGQHAWLTNTGSLTVYDTGGGGWVSYNRATSTTSGMTVHSGFTSSGASFFGARINGVCSVSMYVPCTTTITPSTGTGNIPDRPMCTIPSGYRPPTTWGISWDDGVTMGAGLILTNGVVELRHAHSAIIPGRNIRVSATYIQP